MRSINFNLRSWAFVFALTLTACSDDFVAPPDVTTEDNFVDLRPQQTPLKDQKDRTTCVVFAGVGTVEAAYKRFGFGDLDLSEEFINFARKSWYLHPKWEDHERIGIHGRETQLGSTGGGGGVGVLAELALGFKIPREEVMEYKTYNNWYLDNYRQLQGIIDKGANATQRDYSNFNLDPTIFTKDILHHDEWFSVGTYREVDARNTDALENVLKRRKEVVWDFAGAAPWSVGGKTDGVWQKCDDCTTIAHSMILVGFDKRDPDPAKHYFIVKNSWGAAHARADLDNYTAISYDYVKNYGIAAAYVVTIKGSEEWEELPFIGRWNLNFDGWKGQLDIYHLPGLARQVFEWNYNAGVIPEVYDDYRIGTFYDDQGNPYRVNGHVEGNRIEFYFDSDKPLLRWDEISGKKFVYYRDGNEFMAGMHTDPDGRTYGGYATKQSYLGSGTSTPRPFGMGSYYNSEWKLKTEDYSGTLKFTTILSGEFDNHILLKGTFTPDGESTGYEAQLKANNSDLAKVYVQVAGTGGSSGAQSFIGKHLNWVNGLITGHTPETDNTIPFSMTRTN